MCCLKSTAGWVVLRSECRCCVGDNREFASCRNHKRGFGVSEGVGRSQLLIGLYLEVRVGDVFVTIGIWPCLTSEAGSRS